MNAARPEPGAVAIIAGSTGRDRTETEADVTRAVACTGTRLRQFSDFPLALAWVEAPHRALHTSERTVCFVEGSVYEVPDGQADGRSPAELLAGAYEQHGEGVLAAVRGEYWSLLWDRHERRGLLVTDQMGTRAPYWALDGGDVVLASEVPDLLAALPRRPEPDPLLLAHWLMISAPADGRTLFSGVRRLEPGHLLGLGERNLRPRRYWSPVYQQPLARAPDELAADIRERLTTAVRRRLESPSTVAVLLSGGLDSSSVAALAARELNRAGTLHAYSATFPDHPGVDESKQVDLTVSRLGLRSTRIVVRGGSVLAGALTYMDAWQLPPTSPNLFFWAPLLERAGADGIEAMLDGEGGDELFGFSPYLIADRLRHGRVLSALRLTRQWPEPRPPSFARVRSRLAKYGIKGAMPPLAHELMRQVRPMRRYTPPWLPRALAKEWLDSERSEAEWKHLDGPRWWAYLTHAVTRSPGPPLTYEQSRRRAWLAGLHAVHPLVDVDVIELALKVPPELLFDRRFSRPILRASMSGLLPDEVRLRPAKSNFDSLFHSAIAGADSSVARELLTSPDAALRNYIDVEAMRRQLLDPEPPAGGRWRQEWAIRLWRLLSAECWLRSQSDSAFFETLREQRGVRSVRHELVPAADVVN